MARGRKVIDERGALPVEGDIADVDRTAMVPTIGDGADLELDLSRVFPKALPDDVIVLERRDGRTMEYAVVGRLPFDATTDDVGEKYGGGTYRVLLRGISRVTGRKAGLGKREFAIEGEPKRASRVALEDETGADDVAPPSRSQRREDLYDQALSNLIAQQADNSKMVVGLVAQMMGTMHQAPAGPNIGEIMSAMAAVIAATKSGGEMGPEKIFAMFAQLQGMTGSRPASETKSGMAALKDMLEVRDMLRSADDSDDVATGKAGWIDIVRDFAPQIKEAIAGAAQLDARRGQVSAAQVEAGPVDIIAQFAPAIPTLIGAASNNEEPAAVAVNILGNAGPLLGQLTQAIAEPTFTDRFLAVHTGLQPWRPWVENVVAELRARRGVQMAPVVPKPRPTL